MTFCEAQNPKSMRFYQQLEPTTKQNHTVTRSVARGGELEESVTMQKRKQKWQLEITQTKLFTTQGKNRNLKVKSLKWFNTYELLQCLLLAKSMCVMQRWENVAPKFISKFYQQHSHANHAKKNLISKSPCKQSSRNLLARQCANSCGKIMQTGIQILLQLLL